MATFGTTTPRECDSYVAQYRPWELTHKFGGLLSMNGWVIPNTRFSSDLDIGACNVKENVPKETFTISFSSTKNKHQYGTKITCTDARGRRKK